MPRPIRLARKQASIQRSVGRRPTDLDTRSILNAIHQSLESHGWTCVDLAKRIKMPQSTMYAVMNPESSGYGPLRITVIRRIAEGLNVSIHQLLADLQDRVKP